MCCRPKRSSPAPPLPKVYLPVSMMQASNAALKMPRSTIETEVSSNRASSYQKICGNYEMELAETTLLKHNSWRCISAEFSTHFRLVFSSEFCGHHAVRSLIWRVWCFGVIGPFQGASGMTVHVATGSRQRSEKNGGFDSNVRSVGELLRLIHIALT